MAFRSVAEYTCCACREYYTAYLITSKNESNLLHSTEACWVGARDMTEFGHGRLPSSFRELRRFLVASVILFLFLTLCLSLARLSAFVLVASRCSPFQLLIVPQLNADKGVRPQSRLHPDLIPFEAQRAHHVEQQRHFLNTAILPVHLPAAIATAREAKLAGYLG